MTQHPVDIAIITVTKEEHEAVRKQLPSLGDLVETNRTYALCKIHSQLHGFSIALVNAIEQGPTAGYDVTRDAIEDLDPYCIFVVGIAGAVPDADFTLGDVIVATRLHDFTVGAIKEGSDSEFQDQGGPMARVVQDLVMHLRSRDDKLSGWNEPEQITVPRPSVRLDLQNFYGSEEWRNKTLEALNVYFGPQPRRSHPDWIARPIASSGFLVKDTHLVERWLTHARHIAAIEMELGGVYKAAAQRIDKQYPILAIRGISDIVGFKRDPAWTEYACNSAASFMIMLLKCMPDTIFVRRMRYRKLLPPPPIVDEDNADEETRFRKVH
jgi:nucleoside phosphorylase